MNLPCSWGVLLMNFLQHRFGTGLPIETLRSGLAKVQFFPSSCLSPLVCSIVTVWFILFWCTAVQTFEGFTSKLFAPWFEINTFCSCFHCPAVVKDVFCQSANVNIDQSSMSCPLLSKGHHAVWADVALPVLQQIPTQSKTSFVQKAQPTPLWEGDYYKHKHKVE